MAATAAARTSPIEGAYEAKLAGNPVALLNGTWQVQIEADGHYVITRNGVRAVSGLSRKVVRPQPDTISFTDQNGPAACLGKTATGTYTWTLKRQVGHVYLVLGHAHDACAGRKAVLTTHPLLKIL